jgi:hypothetical protein
VGCDQEVHIISINRPGDFGDLESDGRMLPGSDEISVSTLARVFDDTTNSYKYLFFLALLDAIQRQVFDPSRRIPIDELTIDMLVLAWYPHVYFRLSFGKQDKIVRELEGLTPDVVAAKFNPWDKAVIREAVKASIGVPKELARFVPFRLIRPFLPEVTEKACGKDHLVNQLVRDLAHEYFPSSRVPYRITQENELELHPAWCQYFKENFAVVLDWARWNYMVYMQKANPLVPSLASKLFPPAERDSLAKQAKFWRAVAKHHAIRCIYSGAELDVERAPLDHFIPWSFVVHDEMWNLLPVSVAANSAKRDRLPARSYLEQFIDAQFSALQVGRKVVAPAMVSDVENAYKHALKLDSLDDKARFSEGYRQVLENHLMLAEVNGFEPGWVFRLPNSG